MEAVQFGRWLGERRHARGWTSQRALAEAVRADPWARGTAPADLAELSEAFLARLEAGQLAYPFRGMVRRRVLALAGFICKTPRDVRSYLRAAGLHDLTSEETAWVDRLSRRLAPVRASMPLALPPRPPRVVGRDADIVTLWRALTSDGDAVVAITGTPGVGKSTLAAELAHRLAEHETDGPRDFPDGVLWLNGAGHRGTRGMADILTEIARLLPASVARVARRLDTDAPPEESGEHAPTDRPNSAPLGDRRLLLVVDDLDPALPIEALVRALLARASHDHDHPAAGHRAILLTSRFRPAPALLTYHLHLAPLAPEAAVNMFAALAGHPLTDAEREAGALICAAVGFLPAAIATAATAAFARGIALPLLAERLGEHPLDALLDGDGELRALFAGALEPLPAAVQTRFALLGALGAATFGLEPAAAIATAPPPPQLTPPRDTAMNLETVAGASSRTLYGPAGEANQALAARQDTLRDAAHSDSEVATRADIAEVASELGHLVRHSLLDTTATPAGPPSTGRADPAVEQQTRYDMPPLLSAYALERLQELDPDLAQAAHDSVREYVLALVERHQNEPRLLEREREVLLAALARAWQGEEFEVVVRLVSGLWHLISRVGSYALTARTLLWGITASERLNDRYHLARFLGRMGSLLYYHGDADQARQTWEASLRIAEQLRGPGDLWHPLANLAMLASVEGNFAAAQRYAETYLRRAEDQGGIPAVASALFKRGLMAHLAGDLDQACADLNACTRLLALRGAGDSPTHDGIFELAAQAELARVQGDFARAQLHTELAVELAEEVCDRYTVADLLLDQARFARLRERQEEARVLARRVVEVASQVEAHQLRLEGLQLLRQLPEPTTLLTTS